jgi:cytochrome b561
MSQIPPTHTVNISAQKRFRPLWVILHWLMALLVFITFGIGLTSLTRTANPDGKLVPLTVHIFLGNTILLIVIIRYILRLLVFKPPKKAAKTIDTLFKKKPPIIDQLSRYVHPLLYIFTALMALLGIAIALPADLFKTIISGGQIPANLDMYPARIWHASLSLVLMVLIAQHVLVAIFHQFIKGENFLGRMWFTKR